VRPSLRVGLIKICRARSVATVAAEAVGALSSDRAVLARLWLSDKSPSPDSQLADRPNAQLTLAGSAGSPVGGGSYSRLDGEFRCLQVGVGKIGQVAASRQPLIVRAMRGDESWLANPGWIARQGVRAFVAFPLLADNDLVGVLALFARTAPTDADLEDMQMIADVAAARIIDLGLDVRPAPSRTAVLTRTELRAVERQALEEALARTGGRVFGTNGAASLLGMRPTTLASRLKALGIR
jgi:transcriptional regulator with GAF, ATPase, and Fis domain